MFNFFKRKADNVEQKSRAYAPNPHQGSRSGGFESVDAGRLLSGWTTSSATIEQYLSDELGALRARSREMARQNPYAKKYIKTMKTNIVGQEGITIQVQSMMSGRLDDRANRAIEAAFLDWSINHCDIKGKNSFTGLQGLAVNNEVIDGEYIFRVHEGRKFGKYGIQLQLLDAESLATEKFGWGTNSDIRLGIEYDKFDRPIRYWFKERANGVRGGYTGNYYSVDAKYIIHGFTSEWADQGRGLPWMHAGLERAKHLSKYEESAIVKARSTAATMAVMSNKMSDTVYTGDDIIEAEGYEDDVYLDSYEAGTIKNIGDHDIQQLDSDYPHQMYKDFIKTHIQGLASGWGISYPVLSSDLEGVNFSSIRTGVLEDREGYKDCQSSLIQHFVRPVFERWLSMSLLMRSITISGRPLSRAFDDYNTVHYQGRRWSWVDPLKDSQANEAAIANMVKSRSQIIREQGDDPETVWREISTDDKLMQKYGLTAASNAVKPVQSDEV